MSFLRRVRCWFLFRHSMQPLGPLNGCIMYQCAICATTISVQQSDMSWR